MAPSYYSVVELLVATSGRLEESLPEEEHRQRFEFQVSSTGLVVRLIPDALEMLQHKAIAREVMEHLLEYTQDVSLLCRAYHELISYTGVSALSPAEAEQLACELLPSQHSPSRAQQILDLGSLPDGQRENTSSMADGVLHNQQYDPEANPHDNSLLEFSEAHKSAAGTVGIAVVSQGFKAPLHYHKEPEVYVFIEGIGLLYLSGTMHRIQAPAVVKIPGDAVHCMTPITKRVVLGYGFGAAVDGGAEIQYYFEDKYMTTSRLTSRL